MVISPSAGRAGPGAGPFMQALLRTRVSDIIFGSAVVAVGAGLWLFLAAGGLRSGWQGWAFNLGALSGIAAILIGGTLQGPTAAKIQTLGAPVAPTGAPPTAEQASEMGRLQSRIGAFASTTTLLVAVAVVAMALGG